MQKNMWPAGETMVVQCPNCEVPDDVDIEVVREEDLPLRPVDCVSCGAQYEVRADKATELVSAPPKQTTDRGRELLKKVIVFDPR